MNKKGIAPIIVIVILCVIILIFYVMDVSQRECNSNKDCSKNSYCGADNACHEFPKQIVVTEHNYILPAIILSIALIVAAYIFKGGRLPTIQWKK